MTCDMLVNIIVPLSQAVVAALVVVLGWYVVHKKSTERDLASQSVARKLFGQMLKDKC
jgi:hypothetical protein